MADKNEVVLEGCIKGKVFSFDGAGGKTPMVKLNLDVKSEYVGNDGKLTSKSCSVPVTMFGAIAGRFGPGKPGGTLDEGTRLKITGYIANNSYMSKKTNERVFETRVIARTADAIVGGEPWSGGPPPFDQSVPF